MVDTDTLLEVRGLKTHFAVRQGIVRAVDGATFSVKRGRTLGVVGESGCGKSVTAQSILRIVTRPGEIVDGEILLHRRTNGTPDTLAVETVDLAQLDPKSIGIVL